MEDSDGTYSEIPVAQLRKEAYQLERRTGPGLLTLDVSLGEHVIMLDTANYASEHERRLVLRPLGGGKFTLLYQDGAGFDGEIGLLTLRGKRD